MLPATTIKSIIQSIYDGQSLARSLRALGINIQAFFEAMYSNVELANEYNKAQQARAELLVDEIIDIADHEEDNFRAKNKIDTRKWYAGVMQPGKYGQRVDINLNHTVDINGALSDARGRVLNLPSNQYAQVIESQAMTDNSTTDHKSVAPPQLRENEEIDPFS